MSSYSPLHSVIVAGRITVSRQNIVLGIPQIPLRFVWFLVLLLLVDGRETFGLLVSHARRMGAFTAGKKQSGADADELKVLHMYLNISRRR